MTAIVLSTSSVFPNTELGFRMAAELGFDGVELMVNFDRRSQAVEAVQELSATYGVPVRSVHVPCLVVSQRVWGWNPEVKLRRSVDMAVAVGAGVVVVHPPFRWQREFAEVFGALVDELDEAEGGPTVTVENMYGVDALGRRVAPYLVATDEDFRRYPSVTLDTSHAAADRRDVIELRGLMGDRLRHVHLSDSTGTRGDEHLPPGMGILPLEELCRGLCHDGFDGDVVLEVGLGRLPEGIRMATAAGCQQWAAAIFNGR